MKDSMNNVKKNDFLGNIKKSFSGRKFRNGAYVTIISTVVIVIILVANMLFSKLDLQFDLSSQGMYTLSEDTNKMLDNLSDDITIYYLVQSGSEVSHFKNIVKRYDAASDKVNLVYKDPVLYPKFASQYVDDTVSENSFLVVDNTNGKAKYIDYNDMLIQELNYQTYSYDTTGIDVEGKLTSAIQYVTSTELPKMYVVEGHGEAETGDTFSSTLDKLNVEKQNLTTLSESTIPEDCDILFINAPTSDFSEDETAMIKSYLEAGGKAIITLDSTATELPNFLSILETYGIEVVEGMVLEGDQSKHVANGVNILLPDLEVHDITAGARNNDVPVIMANASGLLISDTLTSTLTVEPLITTSDLAYSKVNLQSASADKEDGDIDGPFNLGLVATDNYNDVTSTIAVYSSAITFTEDTAQYGNTSLLTGTVGYLVGDTSMVSIPTKSLTDSFITTTQQQAFTLGFLVIAAIPVCILILGGVICYRRRRK